jgi:glycosyltransferase involved in cell wall biosynthesis
VVTEQAPLYIEVSPFLQHHLTGVGRLVARLVEAMARRRPVRLVAAIPPAQAQREGLRTDLLAGQEIILDAGNLPRADGDLADWVRQVLRLPGQAHDAGRARDNAGLYTFLRPRVKHFAHEVGIFYDFTPLLVPWTHTGPMREAFGRFATHDCRLFDKALAISRSARADAGWLAALPETDVVAAYPGPSQCANRHASARPVARRPNVLLVVSTVEPRKNARFLVDWFQATTALPDAAELWWAGPRGWSAELARPRTHGTPRRRVRFLGPVSDARLCELYRQAACTIYPSLYEGFGFPVLDALLHGTAVLCSFNSSLEEFAGPGVYYFDPYDAATLDAAYRDWAAGGPDPVNREDLRGTCRWDAFAHSALELCGLSAA